MQMLRRLLESATRRAPGKSRLLLLVLNKECFHAIYRSILIARLQLRGSTESHGL
jgi:hypothetical protein